MRCNVMQCNYVSMYLCFYVSMYMCLFVCLSACLYAGMSVCMCVCEGIHLYLYLYLYLSIYLTIFINIHSACTIRSQFADNSTSIYLYRSYLAVSLYSSRIRTSNQIFTCCFYLHFRMVRPMLTIHHSAGCISGFTRDPNHVPMVSQHTMFDIL